MRDAARQSQSVRRSARIWLEFRSWLRCDSFAAEFAVSGRGDECFSVFQSGENFDLIAGSSRRA